MIRVLLADDHAVVRDGLRALLEAQSEIDVVGDVANGRQAVREAQKLVGPIQAPWRDRPASRTKIYKTRIPPPFIFAGAISGIPP